MFDAAVPVPMVVAVLAAILLLFALLWTRLAADARQPVAVYCGSYVITYVLGGLWIGFTEGDALVNYFRDRLYVPTVSSLGMTFWIVLLAPLVIPVVVMALVFNRRSRLAATSRAVRRWSLPEPGLGRFVLVFGGLVGLVVYGTFGGGRAIVDVLANMTALNGDTTTIIERRFELFGAVTTATFGVLYSGLPALCHVALFKARSSGWQWRAAAVVSIAITLLLSFATYQIGLATVFVTALVVSAWHLKIIRITPAKLALYAGAVLMLTQVLNQWKFADWTFGENIQHLLLRMPAAYPYYLDCFPGTVPFLGTDWFGSLTGHGLDPASPFVIARFMYANAAPGAAMAAPAHVQAYAEGGLLNALLAAGVIGLFMAGAGALSRRSREHAVLHAAYVQALVGLYYLTQTSFRGAIWHSYGYVWTLAALIAVTVVSWTPAAAALRLTRPSLVGPALADAD